MSRKRPCQSEERHDLADHINTLGVEMLPCSNCEKKDRTCVVSDGSGRCGECVRRGVKCDVEGIPASEWRTLDREEHRIETAEMVAEESLRRAQQQMTEAVNRLSRLRQQKKLLKTRGRDLLARGLKSLDELEALEEKEKEERETKEKEEAQARRELATTSAAVPLFSPEELLAFEHPSFWALVDSESGIPPTSQGS